MAEIEAAAGLVAGAGMGAAERIRLGPILERRLACPYGVGRIERVVLGFGTLHQMKLDEARQIAEIGLARLPDRLERLLLALDHLKPVHCDEHESLLLLVGGLILPVDLVDIMNAPKPRWCPQRGRSNLDGMTGSSRYAPPR